MISNMPTLSATASLKFCALAPNLWRSIRGFDMKKARGIEETIGRLVIDETELPEQACWRTANGRRNHELYRRLYNRLFGSIPDGLELDHLCFDPSCCNPWHLEPVTHTANMRRSNSGDLHYTRYKPELLPRGERHGRAKLTKERVREIRARREAGESAIHLGKEYGLHWRTVYRIERREIWAHVD